MYSFVLLWSRTFAWNTSRLTFPNVPYLVYRPTLTVLMLTKRQSTADDRSLKNFTKMCKTMWTFYYHICHNCTKCVKISANLPSIGQVIRKIKSRLHPLNQWLPDKVLKQVLTITTNCCCNCHSMNPHDCTIKPAAAIDLLKTKRKEDSYLIEKSIQT